MASDLGIFHRRTADSVQGSANTKRVRIGVALAFNVLIFLAYRHLTAAISFLTGYMIEKLLGLNNFFFIAMSFSHFRIPTAYQHRVLEPSVQ